MTTGPYYNNSMSQTARNIRTGYRESSAMPQRVRDVLGRLKVSVHQNIYEADFEYGPQPLRWEQVVGGNGTITAVPSSGGVRMRVTTSQGDYTMRQSRPYHRYQPGKTMFMATGLNLGTALAGNFQRVGFFDDNNGVFFEQGVAYAGNPFGMYVVVRTDTGGYIQETRVGLDQWNGDQANIQQLNFNNIQMFWIEYGWYGAGATRFGFWIDGEPIIAHQIGWGNYNNTTLSTGGQQNPWARTGNLPVRYEQRNLTGTTAINDMYHYGVSVIVEGRTDDQRGFTYSYGLPNTVQTRQINAAVTRFPLLTVRGRIMGTQEYGTVYATTTGANVSTVSNSTASFYGTITSNILTVNTTVSGLVANGQQITGLGIPAGTVIVSNVAGSTTQWVLNTSNITTLANTALLGNATVITFTGTPFSNVAGAANNYIGRTIFFPGPGVGTANGVIGRIMQSNSSALFVTDIVTGSNLNAVSGVPVVSAIQSPTGTGGSAGTNYFTVSSPTGISAGMSVIGTGIPPGTLVSNIAGSVVTINQPLTAALSTTQLQFMTGYCIGLVNRGQLLPRRLMISSDNRCVVELISGSVVNTPVVTGNVFNFTPLSSLGSNYSFAERDYNATGTTINGEVVFAFTLAAGSGLQDIDLSYFFPLYNSIRGSQIDTLTLAITTPSGLGANVGGHLICQEAMS